LLVNRETSKGDYMEYVGWFIAGTVGCSALFALGIWIMNDTNVEFLGGTFVAFGMIGAIVFLIMTVVFWAGYSGAPMRAKLLNEAYGTHYTADDIFWGDDIIRQTIQGSRQRIDLTGVK
jgi:hypothetical protein